MNLKTAFRTAIAMSLISMISMEVAMNVVDAPASKLINSFRDKPIVDN